MRAWVLLAILVTPTMSGCLDFLVARDVEPTDLLRDDRYTQWVIEVDYAQGHRPSAEALDMLHSRMSDVVRKDSIDIRLGDALALDRDTWSVQDILALKREHQDQRTGGDTVVTWVVYLSGGYEGDTSSQRVLGIAIGHDTVAIFHENIQRARSGPIVPLYSVAQVERAVLVHEFGHVLGLVNRGIPMQTPRDDGSGHSTNPNSVMYATVATGDVFQRFFQGGIPTRFDANDRADLCAAGGRC